MKSGNAEKRLKRIKDLKTPYTLHFAGIDLVVEENVYPTSELSELIVEYFDRFDNNLSMRKVLDYGTGTGFLAIQAAKKGADVVAIDINPHAIKCASINAVNNSVESKIDFRLGKNFEAIRENEKFDVILAGMPWDNAEANTYLELALYDPDFQMKKSLFEMAKKFLNVNGYILVTYCDFIQKRYPIENFDNAYNYEIVVRRNIKDVEHYIYKITLNKS